MKRAIRRTLLVTALTLAASGAGASVAEAEPGPTPPYGLTGACNMTNPNAAFGMFTVAGSVANPHGFDEGMITAILNTNGGTVPEGCGASAAPSLAPGSRRQGICHFTGREGSL